jgi:dehydroquinase class II
MEKETMTILVIHGAGMNMRGKVQTEVFGTPTLPEYDVKIRAYATALGMKVEIFHSNIEGEVINRLYAAHDEGIDAAIINPDGFTRGYPALVTAISRGNSRPSRCTSPTRRDAAPIQTSWPRVRAGSPVSASSATTWRSAG